MFILFNLKLYPHHSVSSHFLFVLDLGGSMLLSDYKSIATICEVTYICGHFISHSFLTLLYIVLCCSISFLFKTEQYSTECAYIPPLYTHLSVQLVHPHILVKYLISEVMIFLRKALLNSFYLRTLTTRIYSFSLHTSSLSLFLSLCLSSC